jgi:uncharacterized membrane protein YagU involved in acid resistance
MAEAVRKAMIGSVAGVAALQTFDRVTAYMYQHTNCEDIRREEAIEAREPLVVLAQKVAEHLGVTLTSEQEKHLAKYINYAFSMGMGTLYVTTARRWPLGWLAGGSAFGVMFWLLMDETVSPALGLVGDNRKYPSEAHVRGVVAHIAFGVTTAMVARALGVSSQERTRVTG